MNKKINHPIFQINDSTWGHLKKKNYRNQIKASSKVPVGKIYENPFDDDYLLELME